MASLKQLATEYIDALNQPFNHLLYERIKAIIIHERATEIRRSVAKNGLDDEYLQRYKVNLILVDASDSYNVDTERKVLRSENKIAILIRILNDSPFTYVGNINNNLPYIFAKSYAIDAMASLPYVDMTPKYDFRNGYIYVYSRNQSIEAINVEAPLANPHLIDNSNNLNAATPYNDDMEFLISEDMIQVIKSKLLSGELSITQTDDKEVNIVADGINR